MAGKNTNSKNRGPIGGYNVSGKMVSYHSIDGGDALGPAAEQGIQATGGVITDFTEPGPGNSYRVHTFTSSGSLVVTSAKTSVENGTVLEYLIIGGGGGSGNNDYSGGGGAGGFRTNMPGHPLVESNPVTASATTYPIIVGGGGARGSAGAASTAFGYVANGGGRGAGGGSPADASPGGSGGGGGWAGAGHPTSAGNGTSGQGNNGGAGSANADPQGGVGGGGGAGGAGGAAETSAGPGDTGHSGNGGIGTAINFDGIERWVCGGGGGAGSYPAYNFMQGIGGKGGGGTGGLRGVTIPEEGPNPNAAGHDGHVSTGGGGGGGVHPGTGAGGGGKIQVRYRIAPTGVNPGIKASGGHVFKDVDNSKIYHVFTAPGSFTNPQTITGAEILLIAGGGGGGEHTNNNGGSGGGGAGGVCHLASPSTLPAQTYTIGIGTGGLGGHGPAVQAIPGANSTIVCSPIGLNVIATGGGGGRGQNPTVIPGSGGSGGGGGYYLPADDRGGGGPGTQANAPSPLGTFSGYGNDGGQADPITTTGANFDYSGGGGGGAGAAGNTHVGGAGREFPGFNADFLPGVNGYYAAGGGSSGSALSYTVAGGVRGKGGIGGGGAGGDIRGGSNFDDAIPTPATAGAAGYYAESGVDYTGSGGGAGGCAYPALGEGARAGKGGDGVCIISYPSA